MSVLKPLTSASSTAHTRRVKAGSGSNLPPHFFRHPRGARRGADLDLDAVRFLQRALTRRLVTAQSLQLRTDAQRVRLERAEAGVPGESLRELDRLDGFAAHTLRSQQDAGNLVGGEDPGVLHLGKAAAERERLTCRVAG